MERICSKTLPDEILHIVVRSGDVGERIDLCSAGQPLQVACIKLDGDVFFHPHYHRVQERLTFQTQEAWVVCRGKVEVTYYDIDNARLCSRILHSGDCTITLRGGHSYRSLTDDTRIYEFKTGPYHGVAKDKQHIPEDEPSDTDT